MPMTETTSSSTQLDDFKKLCIGDFMAPTKRQLDFVDLMLHDSVYPHDGYRCFRYL
ncbi:hypothetical protein BX616_006946, partial [Lobosporangium transversale]